MEVDDDEQAINLESARDVYLHDPAAFKYAVSKAALKRYVEEDRYEDGQMRMSAEGSLVIGAEAPNPSVHRLEGDHELIPILESASTPCGASLSKEQAEYAATLPFAILDFGSFS